MQTSLALLLYLFLALAVLVLALATAYHLHKARRGRRQLAAAIHDRALALDRRCDALCDELARAREQSQLSHLLELIACAESEERLEPHAARRLRRHVLEWRAESLQEG